jgi:hypothetical protein
LIIELLGPEGFALFSEKAIGLLDEVLSSRNLEQDERVRNMFAASCAELAIWSTSTYSTLAIPIDVNRGLLTSVEYKCNTFSTTLCEPHVSVEDNEPEYVFFFVSDYWKTRRVFERRDILRLLTSDPLAFRGAIAEGRWDFTPHDKDGSVRDLTVMLWSAKAHILAATEAPEARATLIQYASDANLSRIQGFRAIRPEEVA